MGRTSLTQLKGRLQSNRTSIVVTWNVVEYRCNTSTKTQLSLNEKCVLACFAFHLNVTKTFCRQAAKALLQPSDVVLEVGCCGGMTTSKPPPFSPRQSHLF